MVAVCSAPWNDKIEYQERGAVLTRVFILMGRWGGCHLCLMDPSLPFLDMKNQRSVRPGPQLDLQYLSVSLLKRRDPP